MKCNFVYDQFKKMENHYKLDKEKFSEKTGYFPNQGDFQYVVYGRLSKITHSPVLHDEWRITRASIIRKKTGIDSIADLLSVDLGDLFESLMDENIFYARINMNSLGMWLCDLRPNSKFSERSKYKIGVSAQQFCSYYDINSAADLITAFNKTKSDLKDIKGRHANWKKKVSRLKNYDAFLLKIEEHDNDYT
jgi:hypothetical protein